MNTTLIVVFSASQAAALRKAIGESQHIRVCYAMEALAGSRFDTIVISDNYQREMYFMEEEERTVHKEWINNTLRCRLSSPHARLIEL